MAKPTARSLHWDIYEEHLDEAGFRWTRWEKALDAPDFTLEDMAELEEHVAAHVDGLVLGGEPVAEHLLVSALADEPERTVPAALALLQAETPPGPAAVLATLPVAGPSALAALQRALELVSARCLPEGLPALLRREEVAPELLALVLETLGVHGLATAALCAPLLTHRDPRVLAAVLRTAHRAQLPLEPAMLSQALDSGAPELRDAALLVGLMRGHRAAWAACQSAVESRAPESRLPLLLLGLSGDERSVKRLLNLLPEPKLQPHVLFALGFSGRVAAAEACLELTRHKPVAALAGEAFGAITGLRIAEEYAAPPEQEAEVLPSLEEEDLDLDLSPRPEDALPRPQPERVAAWWAQARQRFDPRQRYLAGHPFTPKVLLDALERAPMRRRHTLALELALHSRGSIQVPTRAFVAQQVAALKKARAESPASWGRPFTEGLRG